MGSDAWYISCIRTVVAYVEIWHIQDTAYFILIDYRNYAMILTQNVFKSTRSLCVPTVRLH
jgi:hypothetical protein